MEIWLQERVIGEMEIKPWICICAYGHDDLVRSVDVNEIDDLYDDGLLQPN